MPKIKHAPTAEQLYSQRSNIDKDVLRAALAEARELASWAGGRVPNGPAAGSLMHGYHVGFDDLDLAIAMIVARVRSEAVADFITRNSVSHKLRITPGVYVAGSMMHDNEYNTVDVLAANERRLTGEMAPESKAKRARRQLATRKTGKCDGCGTEFVHDRPGYRAGPAERTPAQWRHAFKMPTQEERTAWAKREIAAGKMTKGQAEYFGLGPQWEARRKRHKPGKRLSGLEASILFPGDHDLSGFGSEQPWDAGARAAARVRPRKEKIPSHKRSPTGKRPKPSKRKSK